MGSLKLERLLLICDQAWSGERNMALDEFLFEHAPLPVLRFYRWDRPFCSIGYFTPFASLAAPAFHLPVVRRWTGGGVVLHGDDLTFSLVLPLGSCNLPIADGYSAIHRGVVSALSTCGFDAALEVCQGGGKPGSAEVPCFESTVRSDVVLEGVKIVGGAQKRRAGRLLHQGSIQLPPLREELFVPAFAGVLSEDVRSCSGIEEAAKAWGIQDFLERIEDIEFRRYRSADWTKRR